MLRAIYLFICVHLCFIVLASISEIYHSLASLQRPSCRQPVPLARPGYRLRGIVRWSGVTQRLQQEGVASVVPAKHSETYLQSFSPQGQSEPRPAALRDDIVVCLGMAWSRGGCIHQEKVATTPCDEGSTSGLPSRASARCLGSGSGLSQLA